jgi:hypothetical protein
MARLFVVAITLILVYRVVLATTHDEIPMIEANKYPFCSEFYEVEKTVEVVVSKGNESFTIRIEALRNIRLGHYETRSWGLENIDLVPSFGDKKPASHRVWVHRPSPWTKRNTADGAIEQLLSFMKDKFDAPDTIPPSQEDVEAD